MHEPRPWWQRISVKKVKPWLECLQAVATIIAIMAGGIWTYRLFVKERQNHAHAVLEEEISHLADSNLVRVGLTVKNAGHELIDVTDVRVMLEQVFPISGCEEGLRCVVDELNGALSREARTQDRFPLAAVVLP